MILALKRVIEIKGMDNKLLPEVKRRHHRLCARRHNHQVQATAKSEASSDNLKFVELLAAFIVWMAVRSIN